MSHNDATTTMTDARDPLSYRRPLNLVGLGHVALAIAVFVGTLPGMGCSHPQRESADRANELTELYYVEPGAAAHEAAAEIARLLRKLEDPRIDNVGTVEDDETGERTTFSKIREDFYWDRHTMALCQNYLTLGRANAAVGADEEAQAAFQQAIDVANRFVGEHIQHVMQSEPEVYRTIKAYFRAKKIETVAYVQLRELANRAGQDGLGAVYDIKARYAKMYLDSALAMEEQRTVHEWETKSARQDDDRFLADFWVVFGIVVVIGLLVAVAIYFVDDMADFDVFAMTGAIIAGAALVAVMIFFYVEERGAIDESTLGELAELNAFIDRIEEIPELASLPTFEEFRRSVEETQRLAAEGDGLGAARAFMESYIHLSRAEAELERLRERYESSAQGATAPSPAS